MAARAGRALLPDRRLGRARRLRRDRARQLGAALPRHVGHRPGRVEPFVRRVRDGAARGLRRAALPPPRRRADRHRRRGRRRARARCSSRARSARGAGQLARRRSATFELRAQAVIVTSGGIGGNHELVRAQLAASGSARRRGSMISGVPDARRRAHARDRPGRRRAASSTPTGCGTTSRASSNWDPIWTVHGIRILPGPSSLWLDATRPAPAGAAVPRLRHARHARAHHDDRPRPHLVRAHPEDHREGVRAVGLRAEPRPHRQERPRGAAQRALGAGAPGAGRGVQAPRRGLRRRARPARARAPG